MISFLYLPVEENNSGKDIVYNAETNQQKQEDSNIIRDVYSDLENEQIKDEDNGEEGIESTTDRNVENHQDQ